MDREWQVVLNYNVKGEYCTTGWYMWEIQPNTASEAAQALASALNTTLVPLLKEAMATACTIDSLYTRVIKGERLNPTVFLCNTTGNFPQDSLPVNTTVVLTYYCVKPLGDGRVRRRSNGFSGAPENFQAGGLLNSAGIVGWAEVAEQLATGVSYGGIGGGSWIPVFNGDGDPLDRQVKLIAVRPNLSTRRSRRRRYGVS